MSECFVQGCEDDGERRFIATDGVLSGSQLKVAANVLGWFCDAHWELIRWNLAHPE